MLTLGLSHTPAPPSANPDDVVLYRLCDSIAVPPLFEPGPDYEPASPAWILVETAGHLGPGVYVADDGSVADTPGRAAP